MNIIVAPNAFKECLSSLEVAEAIRIGIERVLPESEVRLLPLADGGDGTVDALVTATAGKLIRCNVTGPLRKKVTAEYGILGDTKTAVIEMAKAAGLSLVPLEKRNPLTTTTYGVGELILDALEKGCRRIIVGIGGSATNDCGTGMMTALGARFLDRKGNVLSGTGENLGHIASIDLTGLDQRLKETEFICACDVDNPLYGKKGAAYVYAPQKGATQEMVTLLDRHMRHFARVVQKSLNKDCAHFPGAGAAGGLGAGLAVFLDARMEKGIDLILETMRFVDYARNADLIITGEGKIDPQTLYGKAPAGVAQIGKRLGVPVIALTGSVEEDISLLREIGMTAVFNISSGPCSQQESYHNAKTLISFTTEQILRTFNARKHKRLK